MSGTNSGRSTKIKILLGIDSVFFFVELIAGYSLGSLALVADSFHMLNDVCSLIVALQAIKLAETSSTSSRYSYGWQRAEVLGALINGVFLLALCFSIGMEAIQRFFNATVVSNPQVVVAVGCAGLLSNIVGLFLFHDHGHSHGGHSHGHSHSHGGDLEAAKPKVKHVHSHGSASDRTPLLTPKTSSTHTDSTIVPVASSSASATSEDSSETERAEEELFVHPGEFRANVVKAAHDAGYGATVGHKRTMSTSSKRSLPVHDHSAHGHSHSHEHPHAHDETEEHDHDHDEEEGGHGGHSHEGSMNMRGVFLHVLGDALGNVGVIGAGLIIWLSDYSWKYYSDPAISLIITCIIFSSALPLVKSASFILLQGVPNNIPLESVRSAIGGIPGVLNVHELHVWSLSESKTVASVHIMVHNKDEFVEVSKKIRKVMHRFGIHSSTIQPEIVGQSSTTAPQAALDPESDGCMIQCVDDSCAANTCCPPTTEA